MGDFLKRENKISGQFSRQVLAIAVFISGCVSAIYNPLDYEKLELTFFDRKIGTAAANNYSVDGLILRFYIWMLIFMILVFICYLGVGYVWNRRNGAEDEKAKKMILGVLPALYVSAAYNFVYIYANRNDSDPKFSQFITTVAVSIIIYILLYLVLGLGSKVNFEKYYRVFIGNFSIGLFISLYLYLIHIRCSYSIFNNGLFWIFTSSVLDILYVIISYFIPFLGGKVAGIIEKGIIPISGIPLLISIWIETINVLNQYNIIINRFYYSLLFVVLGYIALCSVLLAVFRNIKVPCFMPYVLLILGIGCLSVQLNLQYTGSYDIMESANYSVLISDFLNFGKMPILETYGGHQLTSVIGGIIYGLVNSDMIGASFTPYAVYVVPIYGLLFFTIVRKLLEDNSFAFWLTLLFPFYSNWEYFGMGSLVICSFLYFLKKPDWIRSILIWITCVFCIAYRLDLGVAFLGAAGLISIFIVIGNRDKGVMKKLIFSFVVVMSVVFAAWFCLAIGRGINPVTRLKEFVAISKSNQVWGYAQIGDTNRISFAWAYIIVPLSCITLMIKLIFLMPLSQSVKSPQWIITVMFGITYFMNFPRGLTRHSMVELSSTVTFFSAFFFISAAICILVNKKYVFIYLFSFLTILTALMVGNMQPVDRSLAYNATSSLSNLLDAYDNSGWIKNVSQKQQRVIIPDELQSKTDRIKYVTSSLLESNETYADFLNEDFLYSLLQLEEPAYVVQSPLILDDDFSQECWINEVKKCPLVLMPSSDAKAGSRKQMDGITNNVRAYKAAEYIYKNYVPLVELTGEDEAFWCRKDKYEQYHEKLKRDVITADLDASVPLVGSDEIFNSENGIISMTANGAKPMLDGLQNFFPCGWNKRIFRDQQYVLTIHGKSKNDSAIHLFYKNTPTEQYTEAKVADGKFINGRIDYKITVTSDTRLRLNISSGDTVVISSITIQPAVAFIDYGYDGPYYMQKNNVSYLDAAHSYDIGYIPYLWANYDTKKANDIAEVSSGNYINGLYVFQNNSFDRSNGNYIKLNCTYKCDFVTDGNTGGLDTDKDHDGTITVILGSYDKGIFQEKMKYTMTVRNGNSDYLIRMSDYYWFENSEVNAVKISGDISAGVEVKSISVLGGEN